jgi:hypothetical protein
MEVCSNIAAVMDGERWVTIIESLKLGDRAYELAVDIAENYNLPHRCRLLTGENGRDLGEAVIIGFYEGDVQLASSWIDKGQTFSAFPVPRETIALNLGLLLGYSAKECLDFVDSSAFDDCECDCCGGPSQAAKDRRTRRTMYHA